MKKIFRKSLGLCLCAALAFGSLAGCGDGSKPEAGTGQDDQDSQGKKGEGEHEHEALTITSFNGLLTEEFVAAFHDAYPEVKLDISSYAGINGSGYAMHSLLQGDIPDIHITTQSFDKEAQKKYLLDLSNYDFVNNYTTALLDSLDIDGALYLLPSGYQLSGIYYNKTILEENNWEVPNSFEEFVALSKDIEAAGLQTMGHGMNLDGYPFNFFFNLGNTVYFGTPEGTEWKEDFPQGKAKAVGNSGVKDVAEYYNKWVEHGFITTEHMDVEDFYEGRSVFYLCIALSKYKNEAQDGKTYQFGTMPWLSEDGSNNMLTRSVSRYMGINKSLADKGNEQKLEDALKFLRYISTVEGQQALMKGNSEYILSLNEGTLPEDSPYQDIAELVNEGRTVPLVYAGWEKQIVPIAQDVKRLIRGEIDVDAMLEAFDQTNEALLEGSSQDVYAVAKKTLSLEDTAKLVAIAEGKSVGADCAMISLNEYHGADLCNRQGLAWYLYKGDVNTDMINMIRPRETTISVLEMTGEEITAMQAAGFDLDGNGKPYEYRLFTKGGAELDPASTYKLAISTGELTEEMLAKAETIETSPTQAIMDYLKTLGTVDADVISWD